MLIEVTRKCNEMCTHCMVSAVPDGAHMNSQVFTKAVQFAIDMGIEVINISGGDPFLHPDIFKYFRYLFDQIKGKRVIIGIQSNGWWIEDSKLCERIRKLMDNPQMGLMQISTHKEYYPNYEWTMSHQYDYAKVHEKIKFTHDWQGTDTKLQYMGRARNFMNKDQAQGCPNCLNWVSYALSLKQTGMLNAGNPIKQLAHFATMRLKTCCPYITVNGYIKIAEGYSCKSIGNVNQYVNKDKFAKELCEKILSFQPCNSCNCMKNISTEQLMMLNHLRTEFNIKPIKN